MPHIQKGRLLELAVEPQRANCDGDYNALFFVAYLKHWLKEGNQRYGAGIARIRKASINPSTIDVVHQVEDLLTVSLVPMLDRMVARDLAFREFYDLIGRRYENQAMKKNGVMPELQDALNRLQTEETL